MESIELFNNLMLLAAADGKLTREEVAFLAVRAEDLGLSAADVESAIAGAATGDADIVIPEGHQERVEMLQQMITLMAVDGELADIEKAICATASAAMGFTLAEFNKIIDSLFEES
jgi:uncharacterized tellurite resistance protein B-like protein